MKSLLLSAISTGHPVFTRTSTRRNRLEPVIGVFPEIVGGIDEDRVARAPRVAHARLGRRDDLADHLGDDVGVADPVRPGARDRATGVRADDAGTEFGRDLDELAGRHPAHVSLIRSAPSPTARRATSLRHVSTLMSRSGYRSRIAATNGTTRRISSAGVDDVTGPGLHPADVDQVGTLVDGPVDGRHRRVVA